MTSIDRSVVPAGWEMRGGALVPQRDLRVAQTVWLPAVVRASDDSAKDPTFNPDTMIDAIITSQSRDSYGDVVATNGMDDSFFRDNPLLTAQHAIGDPLIPSLGRGLKWWDESVRVRRPGKGRIEVPAKAMRFEFYISDTPLGQLGRTYHDLYRRKMLRMFSIHFQPVAGSFRSAADMEEEERDRWGLGPYGVLWEKWMLLSVGAVSIGACPDAKTLSAGTCGTAEFRALTDRVDALARDLTETRARLPKEPEAPAAPAATATGAEGGELVAPEASRAAGAGPANAAPGGPSEDQLAKLLATMRS